MNGNEVEVNVLHSTKKGGEGGVSFASNYSEIGIQIKKKKTIIDIEFVRFVKIHLKSTVIKESSNIFHFQKRKKILDSFFDSLK